MIIFIIIIRIFGIAWGIACFTDNKFVAHIFNNTLCQQEMKNDSDAFFTLSDVLHCTFLTNFVYYSSYFLFCLAYCIDITAITVCI